MKVLIVSAGDDCGGVAIALQQALNRYTDWETREVHRSQNYISYPTDILWPEGTEKPDGLDDLFREADVVHVMERWDAVDHYPEWTAKPLVLHHHGTIFREWNTQYLIQSAKEFRAYVVASTIDLTLLDPTIEWLPNPCDIGRMRGIRVSEYAPHDGLLSAHSPTWRALKGTDSFVAAATAAGISVDVIEHTDWESCLHRKAKADIFYDQMTAGYGLSGIESMAMGIPTIGGCPDQRVLDLMFRSWGNLPFMLATPYTLPWVMEFFKDPENRRASAAVSTWFVEKYHSEANVARQLVSVYEKAMALR